MKEVVPFLFIFIYSDQYLFRDIQFGLDKFSVASLQLRQILHFQQEGKKARVIEM